MSSYKISKLQTDVQQLKQHAKPVDEREVRHFAPMRFEDSSKGFYCKENMCWFADGQHLEWAVRAKKRVILVDHKNSEWIFFWLMAHADHQYGDALEAFIAFLQRSEHLTTKDLAEWALNDAVKFVSGNMKKRFEYSLSEWIAVNFPETVKELEALQQAGLMPINEGSDGN